MNRLILLFLMLLLPLTSMAQKNPNCLLQSEVDAFFKDFKLFEWSKSKKDYVKVQSVSNLCDSQALPVRLIETVKYMNAMNSSQNPKSDSIVVREGAGNYFKKRIKRIILEPQDKFNCPSGVLAYVYKIEKDLMHICTENIGRFDSPLMFSSILIHEARHTDGFSHVHCTHGTYLFVDTDARGTGSCDESFETQGSYGVAAGYMREIAKNSKDPVEKQQARSSYVVDIIQRFNKLPLDIKPGLVTQSQGGKISFYDGTNRKDLIHLSTADAVMTTRSDLPTFFDPRGSVTSFVFSPSLKETPGGYAKDYVTAYTPAERNNLKDVYYGDLHDYSCLLFETKLRCGDNFASDPDIEIPLNTFRPVQFLISQSSKLVNNATLYVTAEDGYLYPLPANWASFKTWAKDAKFEKSSKVFKLLSLVTFDDGKTEYALNFDGELSQWAQGQKNWTPVQAFKKDKLQKMIAPFFWSQKLEDL